VAGVLDVKLEIVDLRKALGQKDADLAKKDADLAGRESEIQKLRAEVERLVAMVAQLKERLGQNSSNSSKPPSSDAPRDKPKKKPGKGKRKRGGQKGHKGHHRTRLPEAQVDAIVDHFPPECENCWKPLPETKDADASWHQTTEIPPVKPHTTEERWHEVTCPCCQHRTRAAREKDASESSFGPRLSSIIAMLTGVYHVSRRQTQKLLADLLGVGVSLGGISNVEARVSDAIKPGVDEAWAQVPEAETKHTDGTSWKTSAVPTQLWTIATAAVTVFKILVDGSKESLRPLFGTLKGILVSDRAKALTFWAMERRQICWSHLIRRFVGFSERDGPAGAMGRDLLEATGIMFTYWHDYREKRLSKEVLLHRMAPLRVRIEALLERAASAGIDRMSGACADILDHRAALWNFVDKRGVEPTNNHAERELRAFVLWRRRSFGTQSARGNAFAENIMTVVHTARKQQRDVLPLLTGYCEAACTGATPPQLVSAN
jgi:transposase